MRRQEPAGGIAKHLHVTGREVATAARRYISDVCPRYRGPMTENVNLI